METPGTAGVPPALSFFFATERAGGTPAVPARLRIGVRKRERALGERLRLLDVREVASARERREFRARHCGRERATIGFADQPVGGAPQDQGRDADAMQPVL